MTGSRNVKDLLLELAIAEMIEHFQAIAADADPCGLYAAITEWLIERLGEEAMRVEAKRLVALLTSREKQVLELTVNGHSSKEVGKLLGISDRTAEIHRSNAYRKLNARSGADAIRIAIYAGSDLLTKP